MTNAVVHAAWKLKPPVTALGIVKVKLRILFGRFENFVRLN